MIIVRANARNATYISDDLITSGSVGIPVTFNLSEDVPFGEYYYYRVEIVDGAGGYDVTELMTSEDGRVVVDIPTAWTAPGVASLRLVAVETDAEGNENARFHSLPMYIYFDDTHIYSK